MEITNAGIKGGTGSYSRGQGNIVVSDTQISQRPRTSSGTKSTPSPAHSLSQVYGISMNTIGTHCLQHEQKNRHTGYRRDSDVWRTQPLLPFVVHLSRILSARSTCRNARVHASSWLNCCFTDASPILSFAILRGKKPHGSAHTFAPIAENGQHALMGKVHLRVL